MRRAVAVLSVFVMIVGGSRPLQAASTPVINVSTFGVELCPQSICGAAIFTGVLFGQVGNNPSAFGTFAVAVTHAPLPDPFEAAPVTGGEFELRVGIRRIRGVVSGGTLFNNGNNTFTVQAELTILSGGSGVVYYTGLLNHNVFPPTIIGTIAQNP
jgi:hypothetical protein